MRASSSLLVFGLSLFGVGACSKEAQEPGGSGGTGDPGVGGTPAIGGSSGSGAGTGAGGSASGGTGGSAGTGGAQGFFGASRCSADFLLCDGFEGESIDTALWTERADGDSTVGLSSDYAARGSKSVHLSVASGAAYLQNTSIFPVADNDYFGRMFVRVERFSTVAWAHWTLAEAAGTGDGSLIRVGGQYVTDQSKNRWGVGSDGGPTGDWTTHDTDPGGAPLEPAVGSWVCVEWEHRGSENVTRFFVDGVEHPSLATSATTHGGNQSSNYVLPAFTSVWFGWWQYQADAEGFEVWIDEVALDDQRIGCEN